MSAGLSGIGPVAVRYAHQIKELLNVQAVKRMAADQEAARASAEAERAARLEAIRHAAPSAVVNDEPVKVDVQTKVPETPKSDPAPETKETVAAASGQFVDELA